jgi:uncharacterized protein (TIGR02302 family)
MSTRSDLAPRLAWWRGAAQAALWVEFLLAHVWAQAAVLAAACGVALLGLVPAGVAGPCLLLAATASGLALSFALNRDLPAPPTAEAAERRLERDSALRHRPFTTLRDAPALPGAENSALWQAHVARARAALTNLRLRLPYAGLTRRDPLALRAAALLLLLAGFVVAGDRANQRILAAFVPGFSGASAATQVQAWIEPPSYTGLPPIFLPRAGGALQVPQNSRLSVSVTGFHFRPRLSLPGPRIKFHSTGDAAWQASGLITQSGTLALGRLLSTIGRWQIDVLPNDAPVAVIPRKPAAAGKTLETSLPWKVSQRWGVASLQATLTPDGHPELPPITLPVPLPGTPKDATGALQTDLSANPYAGADMVARLTARDVSGQTGESAPVTFRLPARDFKNGLARAIADIRRRLALHFETPVEAGDDIDALLQTGNGFSGHSGLFLNAAAAGALLRFNSTPEGVAEAQQRLWIVALALDGALPEASQAALDEARQALRRALQERREGKISAAELARQMQRLREALAQRLQDMARQAMKDGKLPQFDPKAQHFAAPALDRLIKQMEQAAREGRTADAQQKLEELERLLDKLKNARVLSPQEAERARQAAREGKKQSGAVQDMVQREAGLMDRAEARAPRPSALPPDYYGAPGEEAPPPPANPDEMEANEESRAADGATQRALSQALGALKGAFGAGHKVPRSLDDASQDMQAATDALTRGQETAARQAEAKTIDDLRRGGKDMSKAMQPSGNEMAIIPGAGEPGDSGDEFGMDSGGEDGTQRDPLGRPLRQGVGGRAADDNSVHVPNEMEQGRSRAIQDELRRRGADRDRPKRELDYIDRLLKTY